MIKKIGEVFIKNWFFQNRQQAGFEWAKMGQVLGKTKSRLLHEAKEDMFADEDHYYSSHAVRGKGKQGLLIPVFPL